MPEINFTEIVNKLLKHSTQQELNKKTGVSQSIISDLKRGEPRPYISYKVGKALENALAELEKSDNVCHPINKKNSLRRDKSITRPKS